jgi:uncharacterized protein YbaP (TraB family)
MSAGLRARIGVCLVALTLAAATAAADEAPACVGRDLAQGLDLAAARAARADDLTDAQGLLWRITRADLAPSYLFGTIHSTDDQAVAIARRAAQLAAQAKTVATELGGPMDAVDKSALGARLIAAAIDREHDTFAPALVGPDGVKVESFLAARGVPKELAHHLKLWFLAVGAAAPTCEAAREQAGLAEVDEVISQAGVDAKVPVVGLESADEQTAALAAAPEDLSAALLVISARLPGLDDDGYATMLRLYREGRPAEMVAVVEALPQLTPDERAAERRFDELLLAGRNLTMATRAAPLLAKGGAFIAVGALHLPGKEGLIARFRALGYQVENVW